MRRFGIIRCRGPISVTVSAAAKKPSWYSALYGVSRWPLPKRRSRSSCVTWQWRAETFTTSLGASSPPTPRPRRARARGLPLPPSCRSRAARTSRSTWLRSSGAVAVLIGALRAFAGHDQPDARLLHQPPLLVRDAAVHDQGVNRRQLAQIRLRLPGDLCVVGHHHHLVGAAEHLPRGLAQE